MFRNKTEAQSARPRRRAGERVQERGATAPARSAANTRRLVGELEAQQAELELQNEELRQARAELEANYEELYDFAPVGYLTLRRDGEIEKANLTGAAMLGLPRAQLLGRRLARFVASESLSTFNQFLRRVMGGQDKESCMVTLTKSGNTPVCAFIEAAREGAAANCRAVVVDVTSAEQARRAQRETEAQLKLALAAAGMGVWEYEFGSGDIYWSPECMRMCGVDSLSPTRDSLARLLHPEDVTRVRSALGQALADGKERSLDCRIVRPGGEIVPIRFRGQVQYDKAGKPARVLGIVQAIGACERAA